MCVFDATLLALVDITFILIMINSMSIFSVNLLYPWIITQNVSHLNHISLLIFRSDLCKRFIQPGCYHKNETFWISENYECN